MKKCVSRVAFSLSLLQAATLMAVQPLQYFEVYRSGVGSVRGQITLSSTSQPKLKLLNCNSKEVQLSLEITDLGLRGVAASILRGEYRIADELTPTSSKPTGTWLNASYETKDIERVELRRPLLIKGDHITDAVKILETAIQFACKKHFSE